MRAPSGRRLVLTLAVLAAWVVVTIFLGEAFTPADVALDEMVVSGIAWHIVLAAAMLLAVARVTKWPGLGFRAPRGRVLRATWVPLLVSALFLIGAVLVGLPPGPMVLIVLVNTCFVGLSEELMFRGFLYSALRPVMRIWPAILLTSVAFGSVHVLNVFLTGALGPSLIQALTASISGLLFIAIRLRTGSIWPAIVVHALWDWALFVLIRSQTAYLARLPPDQVPTAAEGAGAVLAPLILVLPNLLFALWLLRRAGREPLPGDVPARAAA